ncbi:MAG TPA: hypothetical protein PLP35_08850 [Caldisericia bacterium]|nr:hypothetical protein [Caldisericia bacterium]
MHIVLMMEVSIMDFAMILIVMMNNVPIQTAKMVKTVVTFTARTKAIALILQMIALIQCVQKSTVLISPKRLIMHVAIQIHVTTWFSVQTIDAVIVIAKMKPLVLIISHHMDIARIITV